MTDLKTDLPKQEGKYGGNIKYSWFGYSLRGSSHIASKTPCQDYSNFEYMKDCGVLIACIADGVGSCPLSHWGAYVAVETALKFVKKKLNEICRGSVCSLFEQRDAVPGILREAFQSSLDAVEDFAEEHFRPVSAFFSTLTFALYDGEVLCCEHAGDDGVVAQFMNGNVEMVTERIKGDEASSVYPLQSGPDFWKYSESGLDERGPVVAFSMITDGILDKFVFEDEIYKTTDGCCSGVYYPFMAPMVYGDSRVGLDADDSEQKMHYFLQKMNNDNYRKQITDDLTLVSVVNLKLIRKSKKPAFSPKSFINASNALRAQQRKSLYGSEPDITIGNIGKKETTEPDGYESVHIENAEEREYENSYYSFKFILLVMAVAALILCLLFGILGFRIAAKIHDNDPAQQETEVVSSSLDSDGLEESHKVFPNNEPLGEEGTSDGEKSENSAPSVPSPAPAPDPSDDSLIAAPEGQKFC